MKIKLINQEYNEETGVSNVSVKMGKLVGRGTAKCDPTDEDFKNSITGQTIAEFRAIINVLKQKIWRLQSEYTGMRYIYFDLINRKDAYIDFCFKPIIRAIYSKENEIEQCKTKLAKVKIDLNAYLDAKDVMYKRIRFRKENAGLRDSLDNQLEEQKEQFKESVAFLEKIQKK